MNQHNQPDQSSQDLHSTIEYLKDELSALKKLIANPTPISADAYPRLMTQPTVPELSLPLSQIKDIYQHYPQILEPFVYRVSLDNRQLNRNQERKEIPLSFEANNSGHFWVITLPNQGHFLFPRPTDFKQFNRLDCLDQIFDRINNSSNSQDTFDLNQPATLKALRLKQSWQLEKKGELIYGQSPNHYQWQRELNKIREEYEKIKQLNHGGNSSFDTNPMSQYWQLALVEKIEQTGQLVAQIITELDGVSNLDNRLDHILQQFESTGSLVLSNPPPLQPPSQKLESYSFTSARVDNLGQVTSYEATGLKYTEPALQLPPGAVPLEMASIPGDSFMMGQRENGLTGEGRENEKPSHLVTVPSFFVGRYPITQAQYEAVMGINPNQRMATIWDGSQWLVDHPIPVRFDGMNKPAIAISFEDTQEFIRKLNQITGKHYRLPTEAEWEFVARAGTTTDYCYGDIITPQVVNFDGTSSPHQPSRATCPNGTLDVNTLYPNPWGLYHIHGNVWEWVEDCWHKNYSGAPTDGSAWIRDGVSEQRVVRGGSWANRYDRARSSYRSQDSSISHFNSNGFRIALSNPWSSTTPIVEAGSSSSSIPKPVVSPTPKQTSSKQSTTSVSFPSQSASNYYDSGVKKYNQGDFLGAISDYSEAIRIDPNDTKAYNNRGIVKAELKDYQGAISDYSEAIRIDPNYANAYNNRGVVKDELKDYQGAISDYNEAIRIDPNHTKAYYNRGILKKELKDYQGAISDY